MECAPEQASSLAVVAARGQRIRGAYLRNRLVPTAAIGNRIVCDFYGALAGFLHGRIVPGQYFAAAVRVASPQPAAGLWVPRIGDRSAGAGRAIRSAAGGAFVSGGRIGGDDRAGAARDGGGGVLVA